MSKGSSKESAPFSSNPFKSRVTVSRLNESMSGIIGHTTYALLALKAAKARKLPVSGVIENHLSSYLAGAYLGCDVQTLPAAICKDTGEPVGYGSSPIEKSPITGGDIEPFKLEVADREFIPREIHDLFYGRTHLILGWQKEAPEDLKIPLSSLLDYSMDVTSDTIDLFGPGRRSLAYVMGWLTHVTGDGLIKSVIDGINLHLLDGKYTAKNRPIQDLISFNDIGIGELKLDWAALLDDLATTPVEPIQLHYMRCAERQGRLGAHFEIGWAPELSSVLQKVLEENRRYQQIRNARLIDQLTVRNVGDGSLACDAELSQLTGGMSYHEMQEAAEKANFRHALWQMGEIIADFFEKMTEREEKLQELKYAGSQSWGDLTKRWAK